MSSTDFLTKALIHVDEIKNMDALLARVNDSLNALLNAQVLAILTPETSPQDAIIFPLGNIQYSEKFKARMSAETLYYNSKAVTTINELTQFQEKYNRLIKIVKSTDTPEVTIKALMEPIARAVITIQQLIYKVDTDCQLAILIANTPLVNIIRTLDSMNKVAYPPVLFASFAKNFIDIINSFRKLHNEARNAPDKNLDHHKNELMENITFSQSFILNITQVLSNQSANLSEFEIQNCQDKINKISKAIELLISKHSESTMPLYNEMKALSNKISECKKSCDEISMIKAANNNTRP